MSDERFDRLRHAYAAFSRGDFDAAVSVTHPDFEFFPPGDQPPYKGAESFRAWMEPDAFASQVIEPLEFVASGDRVLAKQHTTARGAGSGIELELISWAVWTFNQDGLVTRAEIYLEHEEDRAREAAGLAP